MQNAYDHERLVGRWSPVRKEWIRERASAGLLRGTMW
jgi:hypothetical protein